MNNFLWTVVAVVVGMSFVLFAYEKIKESQRDQHINAAYLTQGIANTAPYRMLIEEYWNDTGKLPCSTDELPARPPAGAHALSSIEITACGQITLTFNELSGVDGGTLIFEASEKPGPMGRDLDWRCYSDSFVNLGKLIPQCRARNDVPERAGTRETDPVDLAATT